jgi:hypothetical protein
MSCSFLLLVEKLENTVGGSHSQRYHEIRKRGGGFCCSPEAKQTQLFAYYLLSLSLLPIGKKTTQLFAAGFQLIIFVGRPLPHSPSERKNRSNDNMDEDLDDDDDNDDDDDDDDGVAVVTFRCLAPV